MQPSDVRMRLLQSVRERDEREERAITGLFLALRFGALPRLLLLFALYNSLRAALKREKVLVEPSTKESFVFGRQSNSGVA